jgi:hypothetical protein
MSRKLLIDIDMDSPWLFDCPQNQVTLRLGMLLNNAMERYEELFFMNENDEISSDANEGDAKYTGVMTMRLKEITDDRRCF